MTGPPIIALLTDFGLVGPYAGILKGVILSGAPDARIVDLTHEVQPQAIDEAAFLLQTSWRFFPAGTIFLVIVDPGVGSARRRLAIASEGMLFLGPDNGCLSTALPDALRGARQQDELYEARPIRLDRSVAAVSIENEALFHTPVSPTFEGRDVFAPIAAYLANGGAIGDLGPAIRDVAALPAFRAPRADGRLRGQVVHIDTFGNLLTDIRAEDIGTHETFKVLGQEVSLARTYAGAPSDEPVAVPGSSGFVEIALPGGNAAEELDAAVGDEVEEL